jgi:DNA-binding NarL/FixJ family response regulator
MAAWLEVWGVQGSELVALDGDRLTVGRSLSCEIALTTDTTVSRLHAVLQRYGHGWCIHDVGSANGTFLNGRRLATEQRLSAGDEIQIGKARMVFRTRDSDAAGPTDMTEGPPVLTKREQEILVALCRPLLGGQPFPQPGTVKELAEQFVVSEGAVKFHLSSLYNKFGLVDEGDSRRVRLANEAVRRRAVTLADLHDRPS